MAKAYLFGKSKKIRKFTVAIRSSDVVLQAKDRD